MRLRRSENSSSTCARAPQATPPRDPVSQKQDMRGVKGTDPRIHYWNCAIMRMAFLFGLVRAAERVTSLVTLEELRHNVAADSNMPISIFLCVVDLWGTA